MKKEMKEGKFEWTTEDIRLYNRLIFDQGERVRLTILSPKVAVTFSHYESTGNTRTVTRCKQLDGELCPKCEAGNVAQPRFGCIVLVYRDFKPKITWEILPWLFGKDKFIRLKEIAYQLHERDENFLKRDLQVYCYNEMYQNVKIEPILEKEGLMFRIPTIKTAVVSTLKEINLDVFKMMTSGADTNPPTDAYPASEHESPESRSQSVSAAQPPRRQEPERGVPAPRSKTVPLSSAIQTSVQAPQSKPLSSSRPGQSAPIQSTPIEESKDYDDVLDSSLDLNLNLGEEQGQTPAPEGRFQSPEDVLDASIEDILSGQ